MAKMTEEKAREITEKKRARDAMRTAIRGFLNDKETLIDEEVKAAIIELTGCMKEGRLTRPGMISTLADLFKEKINVSSFEMFESFEFGRAEMSKWITKMIKDLPENERVWVERSDDGKTYTLVGEGAEAPEGWTGYTPVQEEVL